MSTRVKPKKALGQHFLNDRNIAEKIAGVIPDPAIPILEIGPGMGMLTQFLLKRTNPLKVVEIDREAVQYLQHHLPSLHPDDIITGDFLTLDPDDIFEGPFAITGNFPYNISSQILFKLIEHYDRIPILCGMFQKEVAQRIAASHDNRQYGILSVLLQTWYDVKLLFSVGEKVFVPPPKVQSSVVFLRKKEHPPFVPDPQLYVRVVRAAFNQRRKMLKNAIASAFGPNMKIPFETRRAEQLSIEDFLILYEAVQSYNN